jgi:hypothetical protein
MKTETRRKDKNRRGERQDKRAETAKTRRKDRSNQKTTGDLCLAFCDETRGVHTTHPFEERRQVKTRQKTKVKSQKSKVKRQKQRERQDQDNRPRQDEDKAGQDLLTSRL